MEKGYGRQLTKDKSRKKTVYLKSSADENLGGNSDINLQGEFGKGDCIYLGSTLAEDGHLYVEITHKVQSRLTNYESTWGAGVSIQDWRMTSKDIRD